MANNKLHAKRYSQAVFQIALQQKAIERWQSDLDKIAALARNTDLSGAVNNPRFSFEQKSRLLQAQLKDLNPLAQNMTYILVKRGDFGLVEEIYKAYLRLVDDYRGIEKAEVSTFVPLEEKEREQLAARLQDITGKKVKLTEKVDPAIIGGLIVRVGGKILDGSTLSQLDSLRIHLNRAGEKAQI